MRQFIAERAPDGAGCVPVPPEALKYLRRVLRLGEGERVPVRLPDGALTEMLLERGERGEGGGWHLRAPDGAGSGAGAGGDAERKVFAGTDFALVQFLPRFSRMDTIVRQMTECGVRYILPVEGAYSPEGNAAGRAGRWEKIIREARQQSASPVPTELLPPMPPEEACRWFAGKKAASPPGETFGVMLHETRGEALEAGAAGARLAAVAVGSEGGMADGEQRLLLEAGFTRAHFAVNILRADTAALYGMAAVQSAMMRAVRR